MRVQENSEAYRHLHYIYLYRTLHLYHTAVHVHTLLVAEMKTTREDTNTEGEVQCFAYESITGENWSCCHCKFSNHPLMLRCESCNRPKHR